LRSVVKPFVIARDMSWLTAVGADPGAIREAILSVTYEVLFIMAVLLGLAINLDRFIFPQPEASFRK